MQPTVEFLFDFVSAPSALAWFSLPKRVQQAGARLVMTPVVITGIFKATGNIAPLSLPAKMDWLRRDLARWAGMRGVVLHPSPRLPFRSLPYLRGCLLAQERGEESRFIQAVFDAAFVRGEDMDDAQTVARLLQGAGLDPLAYLEGIERQDVKDQLRRNTEEAVERKVFGVPTFFVNGELFFGQDRLDFVMEALQGR